MREQIAGWEYRREMFGAALRVLGNIEDAEEVVQDALVKAHGRLDIPTESVYRRRWYQTIARNAACDLRRKRLTEQARVSRYESSGTLKTIAQPEAAMGDEELERRLFEWLDEAARNLRPIYRETLAAVRDTMTETEPGVRCNVGGARKMTGFFRLVGDRLGVGRVTAHSRFIRLSIKLRELCPPEIQETYAVRFGRETA